MAGGLGKRMCSDLPKVLHKIANKPMLVRVIEQSKLINPKKIFLVVGKYKDIIETTIKEYISLDNIEFVIQEPALGTGHAIQCCIPQLTQYGKSNIVILSGDTPLIKSSTIKTILSTLKVTLITTTQMNNPHGYGRIIEVNGKFNKIKEDKDCSTEEKNINKVNCGVYAFNNTVLCKYLPLLSNNNAQNEYYLTDVIELIKNGENIDIDLYNIPNNKQYEIIGINTKEQLEELEEELTIHSDFSERWCNL